MPSIDDVENVEALQYGRPGKKDPRKTPAKPSERRRGSKKNPPGSAKKPNKSIQMSKETESKLRNLMTEHNKKVASKGKGSRASMGMLKTVFRRGAGAFSTSHAPNMSRTGWGVARAKAFLYLLRNGRPSNPNYKQDNDLLPKGHPRAKKTAAKYQGKTVTLNKPFRTPKANRKFAVYVKNASGKVVIVRFGDPNMEIKRDDPQRRKNFRSRHKCDSATDKTTPRYWSCRQWESGRRVEAKDGTIYEAKRAWLLYDEWMQNEGEIMTEEYTEEIVEASEPCCGSCAKNAEAKMIRKDVFDNPAEAMSRAKEMGLEGIHSHKEDGETVFMPGKTHEEYMKKNKGKDIPKKEETVAYHNKKEKEASYHDEDKKKKNKMASDSCPIGEEMVEGTCQPINVTMEASVDDIQAIVEASTGKSYIQISGVAFHDGYNKNNWAITNVGAQKVVDQMFGADLTMNHPAPKEVGFTRNTDGGVNEANVGIVVSAKYYEEDKGYKVRYVANVERSELFEPLESGMWLKPDYGVSIGGYGIPMVAGEDGKMLFGEKFTFDHLAIVHKPAYPKATIESAVRHEGENVEANIHETFKYQTESSESHEGDEKMSEEEISMSASEMEALQAELVLAKSMIEEFKAAEASKAEEARLELVATASEMGLKGHEELSSDTITSLIASWKEAHPEPTPVEMKPVEQAIASVEEVVEQPKEVVANYLNGRLVESDKELYNRAFNAWARAWDKGLSGQEMKNEQYKAVRME